MEFVNLTEHQINVLNVSNEIVLSLPGAAKENVVRASVEYSLRAHSGEVPLFKSTFGALVNVPPKKEGVMYITSLIAANAMREMGRVDVCSPGELVRYPKDYEIEELRGQPRGCRGLVVE